MNWKFKALIQNAVSTLPTSTSYATYYWIQRHFGGLRSINPKDHLSAGVETWKRIKEQGHDPVEKVFLEIGTGRIPLVPLAYWLMGARKTVTIDLNPYLKEELIEETLKYILDNEVEIQKIFGVLLDNERFEQLVTLMRQKSFSKYKFMNLCSIEYLAPGNAAKTGFMSKSFDYHTSYNVFEHIPPFILKDILFEGNRVLHDDGLFIHRIDYSDHFSHSDKSISGANFLLFSDEEWSRYSGNRYMYVNRLRHDDFVELFESTGNPILSAQVEIDQQARNMLKDGTLKLSKRFILKSEEVLSISAAWIVSGKANC